MYIYIFKYMVINYYLILDNIYNINRMVTTTWHVFSYPDSKRQNFEHALNGKHASKHHVHVM